MLPMRAWLERRGLIRPRYPELESDFVKAVREHFDPVVVPAGFEFRTASVGVGTGPARLRSHRRRGESREVRETAVLYEVDSSDLRRRFPNLPEAAASAPDPGGEVDLWIALDVDRRSVRVELGGVDVVSVLQSVSDIPAPDRPGWDEPRSEADAVRQSADVLRRALRLASQQR